MADISSLPFVNFGGSQAQQAQASSSANLQNQQAQAAAMQNQLMAAKLPMMLAAYKGAEEHINDFSGQHNGDHIPTAQYNSDEDQSGVGSGPPASQNRVRPYDMIGRDAKTTNAAQGAIQSKYYVDPAGTDQEQAAIRQAYDWSQRAHMIDPALGASADKQLEAAKYQKDQGVLERTRQANLDASRHYEALSSVSTSDHPWQQLAAVDKESAARIKAQNPNASDDDLDQIAQTQAESAGAFLHRFTGRKSVKGEDGIYRDEDTSEPTLGITPAGFKPEDIQKIREWANTPSTRKDENGRDVTKTNGEWAGFENADQAVAKSVAQARAQQASQIRVEQKRQSGVVIQAHAGVPAGQRMPPPGMSQDSVVQSTDAANTPQAQGAAAGHQINKPPGSQPTPPTVVPPPKSPTATKNDLLPSSPNSPNGKLDLSDIQKSNSPNVPGALPHGTAASDQDNKYWTELQKKNSEVGQTAQGANTAIQIATNAQNALKADAATGGTAHARQWMATALGNPESLKFILGDATSSAILRKMLGNASFEQLETDANGNAMRLGSQTIKVAMTQLSASPEMTPEAIKGLTDQMIKNAGYEKQKGIDYGVYRAKGGDVTDFDRWYNSKYPNKTLIDQGQDRPDITEEAHGKLKHGEEFYWQGKVHHKGID